MARRPRAAPLETRTARLKLPVQKKPHHYTALAPGIGLAYRRCQGAGRWVVRVADGHGRNWIKAFAIADDHEAADGEHVLDFWQAQDAARSLVRGTASASPLVTVTAALDAYATDLRSRGAAIGNAYRVRYRLPSVLADKPVGLLTARELARWRDGLIAVIKPASANRLARSLKAALNLAARHDRRITNADAWRDGLVAIPDATRARNVILSEAQVLALIAAGYAENDSFGLLVETAAVTGARPSSLGRLEVGDLLTDRPEGPALDMPSSRKGRGRKRIDRIPVPIPGSLAAKLRQAAGARSPSASLLVKADGTAWCSASSDQRRPFMRAVERAGLDPAVTFYALRHSSIVRALLAGVPTRVVAAAHDTSVPMLEVTYSKHIANHADAVLRRGLLDTTRTPVDNVVAFKG